MNKLNLVIIVMLCFNLGCKLKKETFSQKRFQPQDIFVIAEGASLFFTDNSIDENIKDSNILFKGKIHDTGALNLLYVYEYNENQIYESRYFFDKRYYKNKFNYKWAEVEGHITETSKYKVLIEADTVRLIDNMESDIAEAIKYACNFVNVNRKNFNLNTYKETQRFKNALSEFKNVDLNTTAFESDSTITFIDFNKQILGINCGRHILRKTAQRNDFLCYHAIYDLKQRILLKVLVQNTGSFLE